MSPQPRLNWGAVAMLVALAGLAALARKFTASCGVARIAPTDSSGPLPPSGPVQWNVLLTAVTLMRYSRLTRAMSAGHCAIVKSEAPRLMMTSTLQIGGGLGGGGPGGGGGGGLGGRGGDGDGGSGGGDGGGEHVNKGKTNLQGGP